MYRVPLGTCYVYGLSQSSLIQWSPCKRVYLTSLDRCNTDFPVSGIARKCCYDKPSCYLNERRGKGRFGSPGFKENSERGSFCDVGEAEVLLGLLSESVDEEFDDMKKRRGSSWKKRVLEIKRSGIESDHIHKKGDKLGAVRRTKLEAELEEDSKMRKEHRRGDGEDVLLGGGVEKKWRAAREVMGGKNLVRRREEDKEVFLSSERKKEICVPRQEKEQVVRKSYTEREMNGTGEDFSVVDHGNKVRREGSTCSSYYSASSRGDIESDNEVQIEKGQNHTKLSRRNGEFSRYGEVGQHVRTFEDHSEGQGSISRKEDASVGPYVGSHDIDHNLQRKKSEKRLGGTSIEENEFRKKESSHKQSRVSGVDEIKLGKERSTSKACDDKKWESSSAEQVTQQSEIRMKHEKFLGEPQIQEVAVRGSFGKGESNIRKKHAEASSYITEEKQKQAREVTGQVTKDEHRTYISERQSYPELIGQEEYKTNLHSSSSESRGKSSQTSAGGCTRIMELPKLSGQPTSSMHPEHPLMMGCENGNSVNTQKSQAYSSSQVSSSSKLESMSGFAAQRLSSETAQSGLTVPTEHSKDRPYQMQEESQETQGVVIRNEKVRHEVSSSEIRTETELILEGEQQNPKVLSQIELGESQLKENVSTTCLDEMWVDQSIQETSKTEIKRSGQPLWHIIRDIVRLRWISSSGSGGLCPSHQSTTSSEAWIAGEKLKHDNRSQYEHSSDKLRIEDVQLQGEASNSSHSVSPTRITNLVSNEEKLQKTAESRELIVPSSASSEISFPEVKDLEVRQRRRFQRVNQVMKDRFDEWEEAYKLETEQRKADEMFMREALLEAKKAACNWEVPVGAVLVKGGKIISRGCNLVEELRDSTAHAEMICIREASNILRSWRLSETTLYVTLEPCPMCAGAILQARIDTLVWGAPNKLLGADGSWIRLFPDGDGQQSTDKPLAPVHPFHPKMNVRRGVLASECAESMQQFFQLRRKKEKKPDEPPPPRLPISTHPNRFLAKIHDAFHLMFCL
ncbi:unnamed protein product [Cuscuta campestris]|uniref:tRNA(adenine(34)) deaminase n=1 Tax=Cuscuta campestris TaxID=132261 RepID=A0A484KN13_9ASTE|nr:unnamed protein product [Cuscuta campestris]